MPKIFQPGVALPASDLNTNMLQPGTTATGTRLVGGVHSGSFSSQAAVSGSITFGFTFSAAPKVIGVPLIGSNFDVILNWTAAPGTTSVAFRLWQSSGTVITGAYSIHWFAVGPA